MVAKIDTCRARRARPAENCKPEPVCRPLSHGIRCTQQIIALTWNSHDPAQSPFATRAASYPVTGGRLEEVVEMGPDLVILSPFSMSNRRQTLHRLGIATFTVNAANEYDAARGNYCTRRSHWS